MATRFKRSLFGYAPRAVDQALAERESALAFSTSALIERGEEVESARRQIEHLEGVCDMLSERVVGRERELAVTRTEAVRLLAELERLRAGGDAASAALAALAGELDGIRSQARGQATRIRMGALRDAARLSGWIAELTKRPEEARDGVLEEVMRAIERLGEGGDDEYEAEEPVVANGDSWRDPTDVFDGLVEIEVGPFDDFSQLVGFEDAAGGIAATSQISVKRFASGRATLEMQLIEPVELLRELEERSPFEFRVRDRRFDRLVLDVGADG